MNMNNKRKAPINIKKEDFRKIGYKLIDDISDFLDTIEKRPITENKSPSQLQKIIGDSSLPENGVDPNKLLSKTSQLLFNNSLHNGHPKFLGYITSSAAPIGSLADLLAASVNPNTGAQILSPIATEIEKQTIKWLAEFIGVSPNYGGILVSGGNMANFTGFLVAKTAKTSKEIRDGGLPSSAKKFTIYCSKTTHTWIEKAVILFGLGTNSIRWIETDEFNKMDITKLDITIKKDINSGYKPIMVIGTAGDVSTGVVDDLKEVSKICKKYNLWFHIDGAYGAPASVIPELGEMFNGIKDADSIALDPHKWLYSPLEAGCTLVKNSQHLLDTFSSHPEYYNFENDKDNMQINFYEYGFQNSRGFRALKVWLMLQQVGKSGYIKMISQDIELAKLLFSLANTHPELEAVSHNLSITTFRFITKSHTNEGYLNKLNEELVNNLQEGGEVFLSNAIVKEKYCLRTCVVNFRTTEKDIYEIIEIVIRVGRETHEKLSV